LKLNERESLRRSRAQTLHQFQILLEGLNEFGPEREMPTGRSIRDGLLDLLQPSQPYLASIRQFLHHNPEVKTKLLAQIPELAEAIDQWALPLGDCE
jgi:hypothetical protein